jgi:RNA polymerase sigma-70 factor, ECF subfamily
MDPDERRLVEAAQADPARFVDLYDQYFPRVWAFAVHRAANRTEAEDLTADVFRKAMEALPGYECRGAPFAAWLLRIAANTLSHRRERNARQSPDELPEVVAPDEHLERRAQLFQLVDRLPAAQRDLIELRYVEGLSLAEAGHRLGRTEGAAKQLHRRALEQLREQLARQAPGSGKEASNG